MRTPILSALCTILLTTALSAEVPAGLLSEKAGDLGLWVYDLQRKRVLVDHQGSKAVKPASVLKLTTTSAVLEWLGPEYRFRTEALIEPTSDVAQPKRLYLKGEGDPSLTHERLWLLFRELRAKGVKKISQLVVDDSLLVDGSQRSGQRAFQSATSALSLDFNSVAVRVCPGRGVGATAHIEVEPYEYRVAFSGSINTVGGVGGVFSVDDLGRSPQEFRLSGTIGLDRECETVYRSVPSPRQFFTEVTSGVLASLGIVLERTQVEFAESPVRAVTLAYSESKPLRQIVDDMNHYSSNFIADQLLIQLSSPPRKAEDSLNERAKLSVAGGLKALHQHLLDRGVNAEQLALTDGSGLSHENRISVRALGSILRQMYENPEIRSELEASLPVNGRSGTLKRRDQGLDEGRVRGKTGTIDGVSSLAGIVYTRDGRPLVFALVQNQVNSKNAAIAFEDKVVRWLYDQD